MAKMTMSLSFKGREENLWAHLQNQLSASYYIKNLILADIKRASEISTDVTRVTSINIPKAAAMDDGPDLELDF